MSKKEQPNYYAIIPATVRYDTNLKYTEKLLYGEITALSNKNGYCYAQNKYFADLYNVTAVSVSRWISHLQQLGYIKTEVIRNENINKNVKDNNIKYNIDDLFHLIINNSNEIPEEFLAIIDRLEFNYKPYMLQYMKEDKINMVKNVIYVLYDLYNSNFKFLLQNVSREYLINLYFLAVDNKPDTLLNYYKKSIINSSTNYKKI